ncbi:TonB-dependent receptor [soil metagenome]
MKTTIRAMFGKIQLVVMSVALLGIIADSSYSQNIANGSDDTRLVTQSEMQEMFYKAEIDIETSLNFREVKLEEALQVIARESGLKIAFHGDLMTDKVITLQEKRIRTSDALEYVLEKTGLDYLISRDGYLLIVDGEEIHEENFLQETIRGRVVDAATGEPLPGVSILIEGTDRGVATDPDGAFELEVPSLEETNLVVTYIGYQRQVVNLDGRSELEIALVTQIIGIDELVVVGYGVQRRSDVTGSVSSVPADRLEMTPDQNISQMIQGAVPGVMVQTQSTGAAPSQAILVRGRNSIAAANDPLVVVDGIPYGGNLSDINPSDVESIEVLKDASAAAIYGSRGSNGVILVTTNQGAEGGPRFSYEGKFSTQRFINFPDIMGPEEFFQFKSTRDATQFTVSELEVYEAGEGVHWPSLALRNGFHNEHNLSISGGTESISYFVSGNFMDVQGLILGDDFERLTGRLNLDIDVTDWLQLGTRSTVSGSDQSGAGIDISWTDVGASGIMAFNPLSRAFNEDGSMNIQPWPESTSMNPLAPAHFWDNIEESTQIVSSNFVRLDFPFVEGLSNQLNTGIRRTFGTLKEYRPIAHRVNYNGFGRIRSDEIKNTTIENILSFNRDFAQHNVFLTGVISYEGNSFTRDEVTATQFPNDLLSWNAMGQAEVVNPSFQVRESTLLSQMLRLNYSYDSRYLLTLTTRRDGFSGFGDDTKWGIFPSISLAWNFANEDFFPWSDTFGEFKPRVSYGINGNQAVAPYRTIAQYSEDNWISGGETQAGFRPTSLANPDLGWESSKTLNVGVDLGLFEDRLTATIDYYRTNTEDLLLERTISLNHGITSVLQNIGETENQGVDFSFQSRNVVGTNFTWTTYGNISFNRNKIVDLYGDGRDDIVNNWFIGEPIRVNYDYVYGGVFQLDEAEEAARWGVEPGNARLVDITGDGQITADDRQVIGQLDPTVIWGVTNSFGFRNFTFQFFVHGANGATKENPFRQDYTFDRIARNMINHDFWTPDNPTNYIWANRPDAMTFAGIDVGREDQARIYEDASFIRIKNATLAYTLPFELVDRIGVNRVRVYATARNLATFTNYTGLDPEVDLQAQAPLQREFTFGVNVDF